MDGKEWQSERLKKLAYTRCVPAILWVSIECCMEEWEKLSSYFIARKVVRRLPEVLYVLRSGLLINPQGFTICRMCWDFVKISKVLPIGKPKCKL